MLWIRDSAYSRLLGLHTRLSGPKPQAPIRKHHICRPFFEILDIGIPVLKSLYVLFVSVSIYIAAFTPGGFSSVALSDFLCSALLSPETNSSSASRCLTINSLVIVRLR